MLYQSKKTGFTLVEIMIVIVIIGILAIMAIPTYLASIKKAKYEKALNAIITTVKETRNTSIIGKIGTQTGSTLVGGYGIYIKRNVSGTDSFTFFQDKNKNHIYDVANDTTISVYTLPEEANLKSMSGAVSIDYSATPDTHTDITDATILYLPPQGETILNENDTDKSLLDLYLLLERYDEKKSKRLKINKVSGFIESE